MNAYMHDIKDMNLEEDQWYEYRQGSLGQDKEQCIDCMSTEKCRETQSKQGGALWCVLQGVHQMTK